MSAKGQEVIRRLVTENYITALEAGTVPWHQGWAGIGAPRSMATGELYRGSNIWMLAATAAMNGYGSPWWGTYDQITKAGGQVRSGQHGTIITKWVSRRKTVRDEQTGEDEVKTWGSRFYFRVFNAGQAVGLPEKFYPQPGDEPEVLPEAEAILKGYLSRDGSPELVYGGGSAHYDPAADVITLPDRASFEDAGYYYGTAFHEAGHSTGHKSRLDRPGISEFGHFGDQKYAREELCAEMTAAFLAAITGTDAHFDNSAAYIASWLGKLRNDTSLVIKAGSQAQAATDHIQGITWDNDEE